jgi:hypothetical protein
MAMMVLVLGSILGMAAWAPPAAAEDSDRAMKWQFSIPITFTSGETFDGEAGTFVDINDDIGWGFGFGYHFNERFMLGADFTWLSANYDTSVAADFDGDQIQDDSVSISGTLDSSSVQAVGQFNFLESTITPFVRGNFGWTWVDSNIPSGPTQGVCWWDPWWGYVCDTWQPTFEDTSFSYGGAVGVHAEMNEKFFLEGSYNMLWIDFDKADTPSFDGWRVNLGWIF